MSEPFHRVLVVYKRSTYDAQRDASRAGRLDQLIADGNPAVARVLEAHETHRRSIERTERLLRDLGVHADLVHREDVARIEGYDLVMTLGGDGTLLWASHHVGTDVTMLAINTAPGDSVGYFCGGDAHDLAEVIPAAVTGTLDATRLARMRVTRDDTVLTERVLNDVLFAHPCPAATTRYILGVRDRDEDQRSSGIWVGPAAGSTAAQRSAGGQVLPLDSRHLQYVVREPYDPRGPGVGLARGLVAPGEELRIRNKMPDARIYVDGYHREFRVELGSLVRMGESSEPLTLLGLGRRRAPEGATVR